MQCSMKCGSGAVNIPMPVTAGCSAGGCTQKIRSPMVVSATDRQATAVVIFLARTGHSKPEIKQYVEQTFGYDLNRTCDEIRPTYHHVETCQETVPEAIIAFLESVSFEDALRNAVSLGGDSDTLACITGGIAEAFYGMPQELRDETLKRLPEDIREAYELLCFMIAKMI